MVFSLDNTSTNCIRPIQEDEIKGTRPNLERRIFLIKGASFLAGSFLGIHSFSTAQAGQKLTFPIIQANARPEKNPPAHRIALIIDDMGNSLERAREFLDIGIPLTFSVLPQLPYSFAVAEEIAREGHEIMLHQPMEPYRRDLDPGPGAVYVRFGGNRIQSTIERNLSEIPMAVGVNNHMGSRFTCCPGKVSNALEVIKEKGLFFVDSLTSKHSRGYRTARRLHMRAAFRNIFIDHYPEEPFILNQLRKLKQHALAYGLAIGIGHPHERTVKAVARFGREASKGGLGISLTHVSDLLHSEG